MNKQTESDIRRLDAEASKNWDVLSLAAQHRRILLHEVDILRGQLRKACTEARQERENLIAEINRLKAKELV
jgi:hypothetical protein